MEIFSSLVIWIGIITALIFLYKYLTRNFGYWKTQGIPEIKPYPIFGSEFALLRKNIHEVDMERMKKYGRIYGSYFFSAKAINITDPEMIKHILIKDFPVFVNRQTTKMGISMFDKAVTTATDDEWKRIRSIISPTFSSGKIRKMAFLLKKGAKKLTEQLMECCDKKVDVNIKDEISKFSIEFIAACAFGVTIDPFKNPDHPFIQNTKKIFTSGSRSFVLFVFITQLPGFLTPIKQLFMKSLGLTFFEEVAVEVIEKRRSSNEKHVDFLQLMIDAKDETPESSETDQNGGGVTENVEKKSHWKKHLDEEEIVAQCSTFLAAGHDTISTTIAYLAYSLASNLDVQETLLREVDDVWEEHGDIDYDIVNKMPYLNAVISETQRYYTLALRIQRQAKEDYNIPNTSIIIPKNAMVFIPTFALHRDPEFFPDPETFNPDRFLPENKDNIVPCSFLPFGDGPRNCVAMRFALMEMKICLAYVLRYIKFTPNEDTHKPLKFYLGLGGLQCKKLPLQLEKRRAMEM